MAATFHPPKTLSLFMFLFISEVPQSFSKSSSPQNIQTFYPFPPLPPVIIPPPRPSVNDPPNTSPTPPLQPPSPPSKSSTRSAVGKAIGVTAASTLVLSGIIFFLLLRYSRRKREENVVAAAGNGGAGVVAPRNNSFTRYSGNVKGLIVDENGLDVLYWRNLQEGENRGSFKKHRSLRDEQKEEKRVVSERERRNNRPQVQEIPLLRGKSSTSQSPIWGEKQDHIMDKAPSLSNGMTSKIEKQDSSVKVIQHATSTLPPPPGAPPRPPATPQPLLAVAAVPKDKMAASPTPPPPPMPLKKGPATPPPPPLASNKGPAPSPPQPPSAGTSASSMRRPPPTDGPSKRSSSVGEGSPSNGNGQMKLKPLHRDKVNPNVEHSVAWDKIDKGSFKFDGDLMEALFGYVATNRKSPRRDRRSTSPLGDKSGPPSKFSS